MSPNIRDYALKTGDEASSIGESDERIGVSQPIQLPETLLVIRQRPTQPLDFLEQQHSII
jgi:hypothetical protein